MTKEIHKIFVYGTLKRGASNHRHFLSGAHFVGEAVTTSKFKMLNSGFPVLMRDTEVGAVRGEVFAVCDAQLRDIDGLEGVRNTREGGMYLRDHETVTYPDGSTEEVMLYVGNPRYWDKRNHDDKYTRPDGTLEWGR